MGEESAGLVTARTWWIGDEVKARARARDGAVSRVWNRRGAATTHLNTTQSLLTNKVNDDREESIGIITLDLELQVAATSARILRDLGNDPIESSLWVEGVFAVRWGFGDGGLSAGREGEGDENIVEGEGGVRELVFEGNGGGARVDGGPAVDFRGERERERRVSEARGVGERPTHSRWELHSRPCPSTST